MPIRWLSTSAFATIERVWQVGNPLHGALVEELRTEDDRFDQNAETITVISNPENPKPEVISREDIDEMEKSSTSLMPKGLLDRFTQEEILALLHHITSAASASN